MNQTGKKQGQRGDVERGSSGDYHWLDLTDLGKYANPSAQVYANPTESGLRRSIN